MLAKPAMRAAVAAVACLIGGASCSSMPHSDRARQSASQTVPARSALESPQPDITQVAYQPYDPIPEPVQSPEPSVQERQLDLEALVADVLRRNPSLEAMLAAWRAAAARYPQVVSLDDPMFGYMLGPGSFGSDDVEFAWMVEGSQQFPWPGKLAAKGRAARAEARAAWFDASDFELRLVESTRLAFYDYWLVQRQAEVLRENEQILQDFRDAARAMYQTNMVPQQDVLQAEVDLAELATREVQLVQLERVALARINTLLHLPPDNPLPPPPARLEDRMQAPDGLLLRELAVQQRPDIAADLARIRAEQAQLTLADLEFYPDLNLIGRYDSFWQEEPLRPMVGMTLNVPIRKERRRAAIREAMNRLARQRAELDDRINQVELGVLSAAERLEESRRTVGLYEDTILPASRLNVDSAQAAYRTGDFDFLRLIEAQRQLFDHLDSYYEAVADYHRRRAELERQLGGPLPTLPEPQPLPRD